jgi:hypothetical protein
LDANRFDTLLRSVNEAASRRGIVRALAGLALGGMLPARTTETAAKSCPSCRKNKHGVCKGKKPNGTPCEARRGVCQGGTCRCGGGPPCPPGQVCESGNCFPQGTCPAGTRACLPLPSTACGDDCFCGLSAGGNTLCFESGGLCIKFSDCETAAECSECRTSADCVIGQACVDVSGCCEGTLRETPVPAGTKACAVPCFDPDS